jgi:hypothetical protein
MYARTTLFEVDTMRISLNAALQRFKDVVLPRLKAQPSYQGVMVLETPEGRGVLISFWDSAEAVEKTLDTGFYEEQVGEFLMFLRQPPGREHYEVIYNDLGAEAGTQTGVAAS